MRATLISIAFAASLISGCAAPPPENPSLHITIEEAQRALALMEADPRPLQRPLLILGGYLEPGIAPAALKRRFGLVTGDARVVGVTFASCTSFDECRRKAIEAVDRAFPGADPAWTVEVDAVGVSMGGLVARCAALQPENQPGARRLRIARLFTISSPHRGAEGARRASLHPLHRDMRADSPFMQWLNRAENTPAYPIFPYVRLGDTTVGAENAAPFGRTAWWVPGVRFETAHFGAAGDARILADIARRLRGEAPFATEPAAPLPENAP